MSSRRLLVILFALAFVAVSMSTAHAVPGSAYLGPLSAACSGASCSTCHPAGGPPPFTAYGSSFSSISSHSSNPSGAIALIGCPGGTPVACTSFTYGNWGTCDATGHQTRTWTGAPAPCTGTPDPTQLTQICNYVPPVTPPPTNGTMPVPTSKKVYSYKPVNLPVVSSDPAQAEPIGVGPVADGGDTIDVTVQIGPFAGPVNVSFMIYAPTLESDDLYFMSSQNELKKLSKAVEEDEQSNISGQDSNSGNHDSGQDPQSSSKFGRLIRWKNNVTGVNENIFTGPVSDLPPGVYTLVLVVKADDNHYYRWVIHVTIP